MGRGSREAVNIATTTLLFEIIGALERAGALQAAEVDAALAAARDSLCGETAGDGRAFLDHVGSALALQRGQAA
jgi:hypothetical protein